MIDGIKVASQVGERRFAQAESGLGKVANDRANALGEGLVPETIFLQVVG